MLAKHTEPVTIALTVNPYTRPLATLTLADLDSHGVGGDLIASEGNVYIDVDGQPRAGFWFRLDDLGQLVIELGHWPDGETWTPTSTAVLTPAKEHP